MAKAIITITDVETPAEDGTIIKSIKVDTTFDPPDLHAQQYDETNVPPCLYTAGLVMSVIEQVGRINNADEEETDESPEGCKGESCCGGEGCQ